MIEASTYCRRTLAKRRARIAESRQMPAAIAANTPDSTNREIRITFTGTPGRNAASFVGLRAMRYRRRCGWRRLRRGRWRPSHNMPGRSSRKSHDTKSASAGAARPEGMPRRTTQTSRPLQHTQHAERHDQRRDAQQGHADAVDQAGRKRQWRYRRGWPVECRHFARQLTDCRR